MTIIVSGNTFPHREHLKAAGGMWHPVERNWHFPYLWPFTERLLRGLGLTVTDTEATASNDPVQIGDDMTYYNYFRDQDPIAFFGFASLGSLVDHVTGLERPANRDGLCDIGWHAKPDYAGTRDMDEALRIAREGWADGLGLMSQLVTPEPVSKRRSRSVTGGAVNVGRMLAGHPDHMTKRRRIVGKRIITVFVETVMWQGITVNTAILRVIIIAAMIDKLEADGYSCNIVGVYCGYRRDGNEAYQTAIRIKDAGEALSVADISFAFGHPSFGRRLIYAIEGCTPQCDLTRDIRGIISAAFDDDHPCGPNEFYIPQLTRNTDDIWKILEAIEPDGLPVKLRRD